MKITVIGGGNIGTLMSAEFAFKGHQVTIYTSDPARWNKELCVYDNDDNFILCGTLFDVTNNLPSAIKDANLIIVTYPAEMFKDLAEKLEPLVNATQLIGVVPGSGGAEFAFSSLLDKGVTLFGLQRVHSIARLKEYGKSVYMLGRKSSLEIGTIPASKSQIVCDIIQRLLDIPCVSLPNFLNVTLTPSNPILHTSRLYFLFKDYTDGVIYPRNFLFYEEWTDETSQLLIDCDDELQALCKKIPLELDYVVSLKTYYESPTASKLTNKIQSIKAFKNITSPMTKVQGGFIPSFNNRYFSTDFPYGLKLIIEIAKIYEIPTPAMNKIWDWYCVFDKTNSKRGIKLNLTREDFESIYKA